jgi:glycosyltransferase involved in cell wall biosynthesis
VGDDWLNWGPRTDAWIRQFRGRPRLGRVAERLFGLPTSVDLGGSATWMFNSEKMRASGLAIHPDLTKTQVANPGIDESLFQAAEPQPWQWKLLYLGRLDQRKGIHIAIEALSRLPTEATLDVQGSGDARYERTLRALVSELGLERRVRFLQESRERIPAVYAAHDSVLFPVQWEEPWGLVPIEAMAVGRPVVASGTGGSAEYLRHEENCLIYAPRDSPDALAAAITRLSADEHLRERLRHGGARTAPRFTEAGYNRQIHETLVGAARRDA